MLIERMRKRLSPLTGRASSILPPIPSRQAPVRLQLDSRDQARRFPAVGPARSCRHPAGSPAGATTGRGAIRWWRRPTSRCGCVWSMAR